MFNIRHFQMLSKNNIIKPCFSLCHFHRVGWKSGPPRQHTPSERLHEGKPTHYCFHNRNRMLNVGYGTYKDRSDKSINMSFKVRSRDCRVLTDVKTAVVSAKQGRKPNINLEDKGKQCPHTNTHSHTDTHKPLQLYFLQVHS